MSLAWQFPDSFVGGVGFSVFLWVVARAFAVINRADREDWNRRR